MKTDQKKKRKIRKLRGKLIKGNSARPRLVVSKSNCYLTAQVIDDEKGHTLIYCSTTSLAQKENLKVNCYKNQNYAKELGKMMTEKLKKQAIKQVVFDRNGYPYQGKIKSFGEVVREMGL